MFAVGQPFYTTPPAQPQEILGWLVSDEEGDDDFVNNPSALEGRQYNGDDPVPLGRITINTQQRKPCHKEFMEWAGKEGYDTAYAINNGKFIAHSPMTTDLWKAWQAAHCIMKGGAA